MKRAKTAPESEVFHVYHFPLLAHARLNDPSHKVAPRSLAFISCGLPGKAAVHRKEYIMSKNIDKIPYKIYLEESEMPKAWYNVRSDMKNKPAPLLNPVLANARREHFPHKVLTIF